VDHEQQEEGQGEVASLGVGAPEGDPVGLEEELLGYQAAVVRLEEVHAGLAAGQHSLEVAFPLEVGGLEAAFLVAACSRVAGVQAGLGHLELRALHHHRRHLRYRRPG